MDGMEHDLLGKGYTQNMETHIPRLFVLCSTIDLSLTLEELQTSTTRMLGVPFISYCNGTKPHKGLQNIGVQFLLLLVSW